MVTTRLTYEDYLVMPEMNVRYEIIDGELIMSPTPTGEHNWLAHDIAELLLRFVLSRGLGVVLPPPWDVVIERDPLRTRQPDVLYVSTERSGFRTKRDLRGVNQLEVAPELVVEILSRSNTFSEIQSKLHDYRAIGVNECWLVRPEEETVEVLRLSASSAETVGKFGMGETIRSEVLPELALTVDQVFA